MLNENPGNVQKNTLKKIEEKLEEIENLTPTLEYLSFALDNAKTTLDTASKESDPITHNGEIGTIALAANSAHSLGNQIDENVNALRGELEKLKQGEV